WSENEDDLKGDASGPGVGTYHLGTGYAHANVNQYELDLGYFSDKLERGKTYYARLRATEYDGSRVVYSPEIRPFTIPDRRVKLYLGDFPEEQGKVDEGATRDGVEYSEGTFARVRATPGTGYYLSGWKLADTEEGLADAQVILESYGRTVYSFLMPGRDQWILPVFVVEGFSVLRGVQRYPWNNLVDIDYHLTTNYAEWASAKLTLQVSIDGGEYRDIANFRDPADTNTVVDLSVRSDATTKLYEPGWHRITWDANADGVAVFSRNVRYRLCVQGQNGATTTDAYTDPTPVAMLDTRRGAVRIVKNPATDLLPFAYSAADWVSYPYVPGANRPVNIQLAPVATDAPVGTWHFAMGTAADEAASDGSYTYSDNQQSMKEVADRVMFFAGEDEEGRQEWGSRTAYGLVKAIHTSAKGTLVAYFRFPDLTFRVLQRSPVAEDYWFKVSDELLKSVGYSRVNITETDRADVRNRLNAFQPNHLRRWETLVTGADRVLPYTMDVDPKSVAGKEQSETEITVGMRPAVADEQYGYFVKYDLRKARSGEWDPQCEPQDDETKLTIKLDENASGLYRVYTLIIPFDNLAITNEIPATNIVGVLRVASTQADTLTAVPWRALATDPVYAANVSVANYLKTAGLDAGDEILALGSDGTTYAGWTLKSDHSWEPMTTTTIDKVAVAPGAENKLLTRGVAAWVRRRNPLKDGKVRPYYIYGQFEEKNVATFIAGGTAVKPGFTILGRPGLRPLDVNKDLDWQNFANPRGSSDVNFGDVIVVPEALVGEVAVGRLTLTYEETADGMKWGYWRTYREGRLMKTKFETDIHVAPGRAFWYTRRGTHFNLKWLLTWPELKPAGNN
ncbi:MAG: hypothetical protein ACI4RA_07515, partial [Kiritimatiellia bacterium]